MDFMLGNSGLLTQKSLDFLWQKQKVIMNNIANNDTPGFKAQYVTFEEEMRGRLLGSVGKTSSQMRSEIENANIRVRNTKAESTRLDGNNVNMDVESVEMARTTLQYEYLVKAFNSDYTRLRTAIKG
ncbi:MAG: flagellar basal body rod protein FlgB [Epulopiscium sp.]|nr:flagellar basal body rod protein FlgB [Candidatus Epulonipiscium sp.]